MIGHVSTRYFYAGSHKTPRKLRIIGGIREIEYTILIATTYPRWVMRMGKRSSTYYMDYLLFAAQTDNKLGTH